MSALESESKPTQPTSRHSHYMRPRRSTTAAAHSTTMGTVPVAGPSIPPPPASATASASASTLTGSQYVTRSATGSLSPVKREVDTNTSTSPEGEAGEQDDAEGMDMDALSKLERKRERNRVKQRNLRLRRNVQMKELEDQVESSLREAAHARQQVSTLTANEAKYASWVHELEAALFRQGSSVEVEDLRRKWAKGIVSINAKGRPSGRKGKGRSAGPSSRGTGVGPDERYTAGGSDPLATLAHAAMSTETTLVPPGSYLPHPQQFEQHNFPRPRSPEAAPSYQFSYQPAPPPRPQSQSLFPAHQSHSQPGHSSYQPPTFDERRRPSTSYTHAPPPWTQPNLQESSHPALKRKRSVSGPIRPLFPSTLPPLQSLSEPSTSRHPFQTLPGIKSNTLPPMLSLTSNSTSSGTMSSSSSRALHDPSSSANILPPIRPLTAPSTPPGSLPPIDLVPRASSQSTTPPRGLSIDQLLTPRAGRNADDSEVKPEVEGRL